MSDEFQLKHMEIKCAKLCYMLSLKYITKFFSSSHVSSLSPVMSKLLIIFFVDRFSFVFIFSVYINFCWDLAPQRGCLFFEKLLEISIEKCWSLNYFCLTIRWMLKEACWLYEYSIGFGQTGWLELWISSRFFAWSG